MKSRSGRRRAAKIGVDKLSFFTRVKYGQIVFDFSEITLKSVNNTAISSGLEFCASTSVSLTTKNISGTSINTKLI